MGVKFGAVGFGSWKYLGFNYSHGVGEVTHRERRLQRPASIGQRGRKESVAGRQVKGEGR